MTSSPLTQYERRRLSTQGMNTAIELRLKMNLGMTAPLCVFDLCEALGVRVRFLDLDMEGMYQKGSPARVILPARRPPVRQAFSCGHELGHHLFGHGSTIDLQQEEGKPDQDRDKPDEVLVNAFSAFLLMPTLGIREWLALRKIDLRKATALEIYMLAGEFGVGYRTMVSHLAFGLNMLPGNRAEELRKQQPKSIRTALAPEFAQLPTTLVDRKWRSPNLDMLVGTAMVVPVDTMVDEAFVFKLPFLVGGRAVFQARRAGIFIARAPDGSWSTRVRIAPKDFVGLAEYRHFEELDDDEEN